MKEFLGKCEDWFSDRMTALMHFTATELPFWLTFPADALTTIAGFAVAAAWCLLKWILVPRKYHP